MTLNIYKSSAVAEVGDRGHNRHGPKEGGTAVPLSRGGAGSPSNTMWSGPGRGLLPYQVASSSIQPFGHINRHGPKIGSVPFFMGGAGSPSNTKTPGTRPTSIPSGILVHPAVWPQRIHWPKIGGCVPLGKKTLGPHLTSTSANQSVMSRSRHGVISDLLVGDC